MERKPANVCVSVDLNHAVDHVLAKTRDCYVQKPDMRPTTPGERAADRETKPEDGAEVDRELGRGQITTLIWGRSQGVPVSRACPKGGADAATCSVPREVSRGHSIRPTWSSKARRERASTCCGELSL